MRSHIGFLPTIYVFEDLQLGKESFVDVVNQNILLFENRNQAEVIEILRHYSANRHSIPEQYLH